MAVKLDSKRMRNKLTEALLRYQEAVDADKEERGLAIDDMVFAFSEDGQWDKLAKHRRRNKPRYTINQIAAAVNEVIGGYKQNRIEIKARAEQDTTKEEADAYNGLIRATVSSQEAKLAQNTAFKLITTSGMGAVEVLNQYSHSNPFEQDVSVKPIYEALETVWFDPKARHMTGADGDYVFKEYSMSRDEFLDKYPEARMSPWPSSEVANIQRSWGLGGTKNDIKIVHYFVKEPIKVSKTLLSDGSIMLTSDYEQVMDELDERGITFVAARDVETYKVMHYLMSGANVLEQPKEIPSQYLPIIRVLGYHEWHDGTLHYRGIVRAAKDPQRVYNYATSANIEAVALAPKQKVMATAKMVGGNQATWRNLNNSDSPLLLYTPDSEAPDAKPIPFSPSQGEPALIQQAQQAQMDLQATIGRRAPAQGEAPADRSGRAILALQRQDDAVTFELLDNMAIAWEQVGQVVMDMIPKVIDTERQVMILGDDGEETVVTVNETILDEQTGTEYVKNDVNKRYRIKASVGPAFETKRTEAVNVLSTMAQDQQFGVMIPDLLAKSLDFPFADELTDRFRKQMLAQGLVEPTDEEIEEQQKKLQTPEGQAAAQQQAEMQQLQRRNTMLDLALKEAQLANLQANIANLQAATMEKMNKGAKDNAEIEETRVDVYTKQIDAVIKQVENGIPVSNSQMSALQQSLELLDATQREEFDRRIQQALNQAAQLAQS